jgi:hypothetical protein
MRPATDTAVDWLLASREPAVRTLTRGDLLGEPAGTEAVLDGPWVRTLLAGQADDGGFGVGPYQKWTGAHWRLVSLVELAIPAGEPRALAAAQTVLEWLTGRGHRSRITAINGLVRRCASQEGNALAVCCRLGMAADPRVRLLAESLVEWQWPDGGWNCDKRASGRRSSFNETLPAMWGLHEYAEATGSREARESARRAAELYLSHRLFRALTTGAPATGSLATGEVLREPWLVPHYPPYWHYDILQALLVLSRMGLATDERAGDALDVLEERRLPDGRWRPGGCWWSLNRRTNVEVVDWGRSGPNQMITLNALRVLRAAGRA